jgi:hypothetical protein
LWGHTPATALEDQRPRLIIHLVMRPEPPSVNPGAPSAGP